MSQATLTETTSAPAPTVASPPPPDAAPPAAPSPEDAAKAQAQARIAAALARAEEAAKEKRLFEADGICRDILREFPQSAAAVGMRGTIAARLGQIEQAISLLEPACRAEPGNLFWRTVLTDLYRLVYRLDDALAVGRDALRIAPRNAGALVGLGKVHVDRGEQDDALRYFLAALSVEPENPNAHLGIGQILLARRDFRPGWIEYEWRNQLEQAKGMVPKMNAPIWNGMRHPEGRILLVGDQGYGDTFQFARYIPLVAERCKEVVLGCSENIKDLLSGITGVGRAFHKWKEIPSFTSYCLLSSLPYVFGTEPDTIPAAVPYMHADPERIAKWRESLAGRVPAGNKRVGFFWSGRPAHPNNRRRSVSLQQFAAFAQVPGVTMISIQKEVPTHEAPVLAAMPNTIDLSSELGDFSDTAAVMANLDLLITVDSGVCHLAGALGRPVWVLMPTPSDWRWQLERSDTPWYPTMRMIRQKRPGDWPGVFAEAEALLRRYAESGVLPPTA